MAHLGEQSLQELRVLPRPAILSAIVFNALIIPTLAPLALRYRPLVVRGA